MGGKENLKFDSIICFTTILTLTPTLLLPPSFSSLHFSSLHFDKSLEGAQLSDVKTLYPQTSPSWVIPCDNFFPSRFDAVWHLKNKGPKIPRRGPWRAVSAPGMIERIVLSCQRCIGNFDRFDQQGWLALAPLPDAETMKKDEPGWCQALEWTYMVSLFTTVLAAPIYFPICDYIL